MSVTPRGPLWRHSRRRRRRRRRRRFVDVDVDVVFVVAHVTLRRRRPRPLVLDQVLDPLVDAAALALGRVARRLVVAGVRVRVLQDPLRRLLAADLVVRVLHLGHRSRIRRHFDQLTPMTTTTLTTSSFKTLSLQFGIVAAR